MKKRLILVTVTIIALLSMAVMADGDPGDVIDNPWGNETSSVVETTKGTGHRIFIDGEMVSVVHEGESFTLPTVSKYGYILENKVYKPGSILDDIEVDSYIDSIKSIDAYISQSGASILINGETGIKFKGSISIKSIDGRDITVKAEESEGISFGMLLAPVDRIKEIGRNINMNDIEDGRCAAVEGQSLLADDKSFYAGIKNVLPQNLSREYSSRTFICMNYTDGTSRVRYSDDMAPGRSVKEVANSIKASGYSYLSAEEIENVNELLKNE